MSENDLRALLDILPRFESVEAERSHRKQRLAASYRLFARFGYDAGQAGHITARDPERADHFWCNPWGRHFGRIRVSDLILVNAGGEVVEGSGAVNVAAFSIHSQVHASRPDIVAAAHAHSLHGKTWSALGRLLDPISQDACAFYEDHALFAGDPVVNNEPEAKLLAEALGGRKAAILQNHGLLTVGETVDAAAWWYISLEGCCQAQLMAESVGEPVKKMQHESARNARNLIGSPLAGWFNFQSLYEFIVHEEPDLLE